ncbi:hypothetical protein CAEBREN_03688 [Caenorhabditis brenneri]|uniref:Uncharacterized protein n=1 Tax=Caenorhabditis brenneri TaxID=135651 RepID=G0PG68_CAEBE|nr:hypothetical protein CAEBREN_03688 [Caenorhabditis brenneri]
MMAGAVTLARECDEDCPIMDEKEVAVVLSRLCEILNSSSWVSKGFDWILSESVLPRLSHLFESYSARMYRFPNRNPMKKFERNSNAIPNEVL